MSTQKWNKLKHDIPDKAIVEVHFPKHLRGHHIASSVKALDDILSWRVLRGDYNDPPAPTSEAAESEAPSAAPETLSAQSILRRAAVLIEERGKQRDCESGEKSMAKTVEAFWTIHGPAILKRGFMTEVEGWHFMEVLKMVRSAYGVYVADDYDDKVSYAALAAEAAANGNKE